MKVGDVVYCTINEGRGVKVARIVARNGDDWDVELYPGATNGKIVTVPESALDWNC